MRLASIHTGDVVAIPGAGEPRLGEVRAKHRGRLTVSPWPSRQERDRGWITVSARDVLAHYRRRARASEADVGDLVLVDIRGRRFHARVCAPRTRRAAPRADHAAHQLLPREAARPTDALGGERTCGDRLRERGTYR